MGGCAPLRRLIMAAALIWTASAPGSVRDLLPDRARLQLAGSQGLLSAGVGYGFIQDRLDADLMYGYLPSGIGGISVQTISLKANVAPLRLVLDSVTTLYPVMAGVSAIVALGEDYFLVLPSKFEDYYWPSALRLWYFGGMRVRRNFDPRAPVARGMGIIVEAGAIDAYWRAYHRNEDLVLADILTLSFSAQLFF